MVKLVLLAALGVIIAALLRAQRRATNAAPMARLQAEENRRFTQMPRGRHEA
ncbi:hypothetical protein GTY65_24320 [Streptomyces sp. SID8379]|uniref:hypothetical protein n=1 Tax=unclassified Streptomyces TaxID=2593676 RepID=UPI0003756014|nr:MULTISPECIES: hypothetical protein [unclassified Streptomyces]MYW67169.1 hypothetical protein [Streptomyces sp. SID8379]